MSVEGTAASIEIDTYIGSSGWVHVGGDMAGLLWVRGEPRYDQGVAVYGEVEVGGSLLGTMQIDRQVHGRILVGGDVTGEVQLQGDVAGTTGQPAVEIDGTLSGPLRLFYSLYHDSSAAVDVHLGAINVADPNSFLVIPAAGYLEVGDGWKAGALVEVGEALYSAPNPTAHLYRTSCLKADLNNNDSSDLGDLNPFILALNNPIGFQAAYPVAAYSWVYHGDCDCSSVGWGGVLTSYDINPFVMRISQPEAYYATYPGCEKCFGSGGGDNGWAGAAPFVPPMSPALLAAQLALYIDPELYDGLRAAAWDTAVSDPNPIVRAYWRQVYAALAP